MLRISMAPRNLGPIPQAAANLLKQALGQFDDGLPQTKREIGTGQPLLSEIARENQLPQRLNGRDDHVAIGQMHSIEMLKLGLSVHAQPKLQHLNRVHLPNRDVIIAAIKSLRQLVFPGYFGEQGLTSANLPFRLGETVIELTESLFEQVRCCLRYRAQIPGGHGDTEHCETCDADAARIVASFFDRIPSVRELLVSDVQAAFDGE